VSDYDDEKPLKLVNKNQKYCKNKNDSFFGSWYTKQNYNCSERTEVMQ